MAWLCMNRLTWPRACRPHSLWRRAVATRTALIEKAIAEDRLLIAFHLAARGYPGRAGGGYRLRHVGAQVPAPG